MKFRTGTHGGNLVDRILCEPSKLSEEGKKEKSESRDVQMRVRRRGQGWTEKILG